MSKNVHRSQHAKVPNKGHYCSNWRGILKITCDDQNNFRPKRLCNGAVLGTLEIELKKFSGMMCLSIILMLDKVLPTYSSI